MPGVPPDALAQVKKGLRGLFSRKKKHQDQATPTAGAPTSSTTTAAPPRAGTGPDATKSEDPPPPQQPSSAVAAPQSEPSASQPGPATPAPSEPKLPTPAPKGVQDVNQKPEDLPTKAQTLKPESGPPPAAQPEEPGMSATSGPLDDQMVHEYSDLGSIESSAGKNKGEAPGAPVEAEAKKAGDEVLKA